MADTNPSGGTRTSDTGPVGPIALAAVTPEALRRAVAGAVSGAECAIVSGDVPDTNGPIALHGVVGKGKPEQDLQRAIRAAAPTAAVDWGLGVLTGPYCGTLGAVRAYARPFGVATGGMALGLKDDRTALLANDKVDIQAVLPEFAGYLEIDYFSSDGTVAHVFRSVPGPALPARSMQDIVVGEAGPPFGTDLIVAVASSTPLFTERQALSGKAADYVRDLRAAMDAAGRRGSTLSASVLMVRTSPRS